MVSAATKQIYEWFSVSVCLSKWLPDNWCFTDLLTDRVIHYSNIYLCARVVLWLMLEKIAPLMFSPQTDIYIFTLHAVMDYGYTFTVYTPLYFWTILHCVNIDAHWNGISGGPFDYPKKYYKMWDGLIFIFELVVDVVAVLIIQRDT